MIFTENTNLIKPMHMQKLQDFFCEANGVYLSCIDKKDGVVTKAYGIKEHKEYIHSIIDQDRYLSLLKKMEQCDVENVIEEELDIPYVKMCGVSVRHNDNDQIIWIITAFIAEKITEEDNVAPEVLTTTEKRYYATVEFLESLTKQMVADRMDATTATTLLEQTKTSQEQLVMQLARMEALNDIVKLLESDESFVTVVESALKSACATLNITAGSVLRESSDGKYIDFLCAYVADEADEALMNTERIPREDVPFFNGKPYMISSDSIRPDAFNRFMHQLGISAAVFQPIEVNEKLLMYLCFAIKEDDRIWSVEDIKFINDVKRVIQSVLSKKISKNSLASSYASLRAILENVGSGIYVADLEGNEILYMNQTFKELYSKTVERGGLENLIFVENEKQKHVSNEEVYSLEEEKWLDVTKTTINWVDGRDVRMCIVHDITEKKQYQKKIEMQANNDYLTGLYNRMKCEQDLAHFIRKNDMSGREGAVIYIDLDDFKHINDGIGHQYGDALLKSIALSLSRIEGIGKNCYRMAGDEFLIILPDTDDKKISRICEEIRNIFTNPWFLKGEDYYCTTSIGIACFPSDGRTVEEIIKKADVALFSAKKRGKNCIEFYNPKSDESSAKRLDIEKNMRKAAKHALDEFKVFYQPIIDITKEGMPCCGAEALIRWESEQLGFMRPDEFIPLAEYLGLINPIGEHVLREAARRCKYWNDMGHPDYKVNVNLSVNQLLSNDIVKVIKDTIDDTRISPKNLRLEVTESLAVNDMERMKKVLNAIKALGVGVALDDFGTGYSSLNHIKEMPIDVIKIDRCFIENLGMDEFSDAFVRMVAQLAQAIDVTVCVEGVESEAQLAIIKEMNVKIIQGFYFDKPLPLEEFEDKYL